MSFLTLKALKAGYTRLTRPGEAREPFNSKLPGNYTSVTVLSRAKAQTWGLIAAISYFNLGSRKCICHSRAVQRPPRFRNCNHPAKLFARGHLSRRLKFAESKIGIIPLARGYLGKIVPSRLFLLVSHDCVIFSLSTRIYI